MEQNCFGSLPISVRIFLMVLYGVVANHEKVVMSVLSDNLPHPDVQEWLSTQNPAKPQSLADITVVGQNPHSPRAVSTRHP